MWWVCGDSVGKVVALWWLWWWDGDPVGGLGLSGGEVGRWGGGRW